MKRTVSRRGWWGGVLIVKQKPNYLCQVGYIYMNQYRLMETMELISKQWKKCKLVA